MQNPKNALPLNLRMFSSSTQNLVCLDSHCSNDDIDEQYEEDSIPGMGSGGGSPSAMAYLSHKLPPGKPYDDILRHALKILNRW